jgi:hypothetical protein
MKPADSGMTCIELALPFDFGALQIEAIDEVVLIYFFRKFNARSVTFSITSFIDSPSFRSSATYSLLYSVPVLRWF